MNKAHLADLAHIIMGQSPPSDTYNTSGNGLPFFQGKTDFGDIYPTARMYCSAPKKVAHRNDVLISVRAPVGPTNLCPGKACIGRGLAAIRGGPNLDQQYLWYYLKFAENDIVAMGKGSTFEAIGKEDLQDLIVPLPPLDEQKRIAAVLSKADRVRRLRRYALEVGAGYLQSVFLEMFYSSPSASKWPRLEVVSLAAKGKDKIRTGPFGSQLLHSEFVERGIPVLGIDNVVQNRFEWAKPRFITDEKYALLKRYTVFPGDVLVTIMGTTGRCAIAPDDLPVAINTKHLCCITLDRGQCEPAYLQQCLLAHPEILRQLGISERGAIMPGLNMDLIKNLKIPLPPLGVQNQFVELVKRHNRMMQQLREAVRQADHLFDTLLSQSFGSNG